MSNIIVTGTARSGTEAFCDLLVKGQYVDHYFDEYFNIQDLIISRDNLSNKIAKSNYNDTFMEYLNEGDWDNSWLHIPPYQDTTYLLDLKFEPDPAPDSPKLHKFKKYSLPKNVSELKNQYAIRWNNLKDIKESWCIKILHYQFVPDNILEEIKSYADNTIIILRKDKIRQAISMTFTELLNEFHNIIFKTEDKNFFDYNIFTKNLHSIKAQEQWALSNFEGRFIYYEDINFSGSIHKKNKIDVLIDLKKCKKIYNDIFKWNWTDEI